MTGTALIRRFGPAAAALLASVAVLPLVRADGATAGGYQVAQCGEVRSTPFDATFDPLGRGGRVTASLGCRPGGNGVAALFQDRRGAELLESDGGQLTWRASAGTALVGGRVRVRLNDGNGITTGFAGRSAAAEVDLDAGLARNGSPATVAWSRHHLRSLSLRLRCNRRGGCPNRADLPRAFGEVLEADFRVEDAVAPSIELSGAAFDGDGWEAGMIEPQIEAGDVGSGIASLWLEVNGFRLGLDTPPCRLARAGVAATLAPCAPAASEAPRLDTTVAPFQEGSNELEVCVSDFAGPGERPNVTCRGPVEVMVDNRTPPPPAELVTGPGGSWTSDPEVTFAWALEGDPGSGLELAEWTLVPAGGGPPVASGTSPAAARSGSLRVPLPGEYLLRLRFLDRAGNPGPASVARIRFDDQAPPVPRPFDPSGWLSRDELPYGAKVEPVAAAGPSGITGYGVAASDLGAVAPCRGSTCDPFEVNLSTAPSASVPVPNLREGSNWISAVAVSGAGVPSVEPGVVEVRVDRGFPRTSLTGQGDDWSREPVTVTARSTDDLSGMSQAPGDDGRPVTVIEAGDAAPVVTEGAVSTTTVTAEGETAVRFWSRDLAGNSNDGEVGPNGDRHPEPGLETVRIDTVAPDLAFAGRPDPGRPERVVFPVEESGSGLVDGEIVVAPVGRPEEDTVVPGRIDGGAVTADLPSDDLEPGRYLITGSASDLAGNRGHSEPVELELPLKSRVSISLAASRNRSGDLRFRGSVSVAGKEPELPVTLVAVETFPSASGLSPRTREVVSRPGGDFSFSLPPGPNRMVKVLFAGSATESRAASRQVTVTSRDRVRFSASTGAIRNGKSVTMAGRVVGPGVGAPPAGKRVVVEFFDPSRRRWRPVEVLACDRTGRFSFSYRFTTITSPQRILFRAHSIGEAVWPFRPGSSRPVSVIVRP